MDDIDEYEVDDDNDVDEDRLIVIKITVTKIMRFT